MKRVSGVAAADASGSFTSPTSPDCGSILNKSRNCVDFGNGREQTPRNIIFSCGGTGDEYGQRDTNTVKLLEAIVRDEQQIIFYDPSVGTLSTLRRESGWHVAILIG